MKSVLFLAGLLVGQMAVAGLNTKALNEQLLKEKAGWVAKDTAISQLPAEEARRMMGLARPQGHEVQFTIPSNYQMMAAGLPSKLDWRDKDGKNWVSPMLNQANCGSCVAFAAVGVLETQLRIAAGMADYNVKLSPQQLFNCGGGYCGWGWMPASAARFMQNTGVVDEACLPYTSGATGADVSCRAVCADSAKRTVKITSYTTPTRGSLDVNALKAALQKGPLMTTLGVYADFMSYSSGVYKHVTGPYEGGHAISIVGYDDEQRAMIIRNSWGTDWGMQGFGYVSYDDVSGVGDETWLLEVPAVSGAVSMEAPTDYTYFTGHADFKSISTFANTDSVSTTIFDGKSKATWNGSCKASTCTQDVDTTTLPDGRYEVQATAMNAQGAILGSSTRHVFYVVNQKPSLTLSFTGKGVDLNSEVSDRIEFDIRAESSSVPMSSLEFHFRGPDGKEAVRTASIVLPRMVTGWRTNLVPNGNYEVWMVGRVKSNGLEASIETAHQTLRLKN